MDKCEIIDIANEEMKKPEIASIDEKQYKIFEQITQKKSSSLNIAWKQFLWKCYHHGRRVKKDDSEIKELMGNYVFIERPQDVSIPINKRVDTVYEFMDGLKKGLYDLHDYPIKGEALYSYVNSWEDDNQIFLDKESREEKNLTQNPFVYTYPERVLHYLSCDYTGNYFIDQFNVMFERLNNNKGSNRAVSVLYQPGLDNDAVDIPCLNWLQATIRENELELHCMFRSNDLYGAWPSNIYLLTRFGLWLAEQFDDVTFNGIHYHSSSLHIYKTDLSAVEKILND